MYFSKDYIDIIDRPCNYSTKQVLRTIEITCTGVIMTEM